MCTVRFNMFRIFCKLLPDNGNCWKTRCVFIHYQMTLRAICLVCESTTVKCLGISIKYYVAMDKHFKLYLGRREYFFKQVFIELACEILYAFEVNKRDIF